jgi:tRNA threonylcarbamoyladenosine biosynthesis protein TsaE
LAKEQILAKTDSGEQTRNLAAAVAALVTPGDVIVLAGDLGAGKTTFAKGFGAALGVIEAITSPTFVLRHAYSCVKSGLLGPDGRAATLVHVDAYRLDNLAEGFDLDLGASLDDGAIVLVEWGDAIMPLLGQDHLGIRIEYGMGDMERLLELTTSGEAWQDRRLMLEVQLSRWAPRAGVASYDNGGAS